MSPRDDHDDHVVNYDVVAVVAVVVVAVAADRPQKSLSQICAIFTLHLRCSRASANAYVDDNKQAVTNGRSRKGRREKEKEREG